MSQDGGVAISLAGVGKSFGSVVAVRETNLDIRDGEFFSMLGPSGCGKTTTLRMIAGFEIPDQGRILLRGSDVTNAPPNQRNVNTVFQHYALFPHMTVADNVSFGLELKKVPRGERRERVAEMLRVVELEGMEKKKPQQLSGGQQQRVALARALVNRPDVLLLDEPLGALDLKLRRAMQIELKRIQTEVGLTFVHVTHDQEEAMTMADTIAVMNGGQIEQAGSATDLYERPDTAFVANFLGISNLVDARIKTRDNGHARVETHDGAALNVPAERCNGEDEVSVGVRPEKIKLVPAGQPVPDGSNVLRGKVVVAAFLGVSIQYVIQTAAGEELNVFTQNTEGAEPDSLGVGREVQLAWSPEHTFVVARG